MPRTGPVVTHVDFESVDTRLLSLLTQNSGDVSLEELTSVVDKLNTITLVMARTRARKFISCKCPDGPDGPDDSSVSSGISKDSEDNCSCLYSLENLKVAWTKVCIVLHRVVSTGRPGILSAQCIATARSHNYCGLLLECLHTDNICGLTIKHDMRLFLVSEFSFKVKRFRRPVFGSRDCSFDHWRITRILHTGGYSREKLEESVKSLENTITRGIFSNNLMQYAHGPAGAFMMILVPRLVAKSSLRKFPRELVRGVVECLTGDCPYPNVLQGVTTRVRIGIIH